ncbi:MAG: alpha/beta fold hydrolase [Nocardioidaceae bacterium]
MAEEIAHLRTGIEICYESFGDHTDPTLLLVMGLGCPMGWWSLGFCDRLVDEGFHVVRFDNRDTGRSTKLRGARVSRRQLAAAFVGRRVRAPYSISDLASDAAGLLDHLGADAAHVAGASMGGMIAQTMAVEHPERVLSLTSIMSTTGRRTVGWQHPRLLANVVGATGSGREAYVAHSIRTAESIRSPGYPFDRQMVAERARETFDRGWSASGVMRQMVAILTQPDRTGDLARVMVPTCVIHGSSDPMVHPSGGRATARAIRGSEFVTIPGMAHDMPDALGETYVEAICRTARRAPSLRPAPRSS